MGVSSTAIFGDDVACDVRDAYRELVANGSPGPAATDRLLRGWKAALADEDDGPVFWLALAATQWACGRLEDRVRAKAVEVIDRGTSLGRWSEGGDTGMLRRRKAALAQLRAQLHTPQPAARPIRKPAKDESPWVVGEVVAYRLRSGKSVLFHVVGMFGPGPVFALLNWVDKDLPPAEQIRVLPLRVTRGTTDPYLFAVLHPTKGFPAERVSRLALRRKLHTRRVTGGYGAHFWKDIDADLKSRFGLR